MKPNNLRIYLINGRQETAGPHRTVDHWIAVDTHNEIMTLEAILCQITNAAVAVTWKRHNIGGPESSGIEKNRFQIAVSYRVHDSQLLNPVLRCINLIPILTSIYYWPLCYRLRKIYYMYLHTSLVPAHSTCFVLIVLSILYDRKEMLSLYISTIIYIWFI